MNTEILFIVSMLMMVFISLWAHHKTIKDRKRNSRSIINAITQRIDISDHETQNMVGMTMDYISHFSNREEKMHMIQLYEMRVAAHLYMDTYVRKENYEIAEHCKAIMSAIDDMIQYLDSKKIQENGKRD